MRVLQEGLIDYVGWKINLFLANLSLLIPDDGRPTQLVTNETLSLMSPEAAYKIAGIEMELSR